MEILRSAPKVFFFFLFLGKNGQRTGKGVQAVCPVDFISSESGTDEHCHRYLWRNETLSEAQASVYVLPWPVTNAWKMCMNGTLGWSNSVFLMRLNDANNQTVAQLVVITIASTIQMEDYHNGRLVNSINQTLDSFPFVLDQDFSIEVQLQNSTLQYIFCNRKLPECPSLELRITDSSIAAAELHGNVNNAVLNLWCHE